MKGKNGTQIGAENFQKLQNYLAQLEAASQSLPLGKAGSPNLSAIAFACGFDRQVLYNNPQCRELLATVLGRVGGDTKIAVPSGKQQYDPKEKRIRDLERQVADLTERLHQSEKLLVDAQSFQKLFEFAQETGRDIMP